MKVWEVVRTIVALILFFLIWMIVEVLAIVVMMIAGLIVIALVYSIATDIRDWWHKGRAR
jgi:hypothetical protein